MEHAEWLVECRRKILSKHRYNDTVFFYPFARWGPATARLGMRVKEYIAVLPVFVCFVQSARNTRFKRWIKFFDFGSYSCDILKQTICIV